LEEKLADPAPKRPLAVTIGAALATLVVIVAVLLGPALFTCSSSPGGMGACLTNRLADLGILSRPTPVTVADAPEAAKPAAQQPAAQQPAASDQAAVQQPAAEQPAAEPPKAETPAAPPASDTGKPDVAAAPDAAKPAAPADVAETAPSFGLLRVEPDGSTVIAGSGKPGSDVNVFMNGDLLGKTKVEPSGDWAFVPDKPLPSGGVELTLGDDGSAPKSDKSYVVVVDPDHKSEPLVVASTPGKMSEVLQGVEAPMAVASAEPQAETPPAPQPEAALKPETPAPAPSAPAAPAEATPQEAAPLAAPSQQAEPPAAPAEPQQNASAEQPAPAPANPPAPEVSAPAPAKPAPQQPAAPENKTEVANVPAPAAMPASEPAPDVAATPPAIDAIEIDGGRNFFAGSGPEGATVRLYVDDTYVGSTTVEGGRWLIETDKDVLTKSQQLVRIDVLKPGSSEVASRAEVRFVVDLPQNEAPPVAVAQNDAPAEPAPTAQSATPAPAENPSTPQPAPEAAPASPATPATTPAEPSAPAPSGQQPAAPSPAAPSQPAPAAPAQNATQPAAAAPSEPAPAATPDDADVPTMVAEPVGDPEAQRFASGKAIIRHGDNLWTIARRVYGRGIKYTTIYTANSDQIRDPDLIYPGQVFDLPQDQR